MPPILAGHSSNGVGCGAIGGCMDSPCAPPELLNGHQPANIPLNGITNSSYAGLSGSQAMDTTAPPKPAAFPCVHCGKSYGSPRNLQRHVCKATKTPKTVDTNSSASNQESPKLADGAGWALESACNSPLPCSSAVNKCEKCARVLCSQRSLKRHRVTCKVGGAPNSEPCVALPLPIEQPIYPAPQYKTPRLAFSQQKEDAIAKVANVVDSVVEKLRLQQHTIPLQPAAINQLTLIHQPAQALPLNQPSTNDHYVQQPSAPSALNQLPPPSIINPPHQQAPQPQGIVHPSHQQSVVIHAHHHQPSIVTHEQPSTVSHYGPAARGMHLEVSRPPTQYPQGWSHQPTVLVQPPPTSAAQKNVYRHLCPECDKPYSCRKNVKRHRMSVHKVSMEEAQNGAIKKVKLTEAEILDIGLSQPGNRTADTKAPLYGTATSNHVQATDNSIKYPYPPQQYYHYYNDHPHQQAPFSAPPTFPSSNHSSLSSNHSTPFSWGVHSNKKTYPPATYAPYSYYEYAYPPAATTQPVPQHRHSFDATTNTTPTSYNNNWADLDVWDQIKSNVDGPLVSRSRDDDLEMARIAEDLKRSAEYEIGLHHALPDIIDSDMALKKPVVLAEADSTFWEEELEGLASATAVTDCQFIQSKAVALVSPTCATINEPEEKRIKQEAVPQPPEELRQALTMSASPAGELKKKLKRPAKLASLQVNSPLTSERAPVSNGSFLCKACNRNLSTEYSLKRHRRICQKYKEPKIGWHKTGQQQQLKIVTINGVNLTHLKPSDPDSTTTFCPTANIDIDVASKAVNLGLDLATAGTNNTV